MGTRACRIVAILFLVVLASGCLESDQWFTLSVRNDTDATVELLEPCPDCAPGHLTEIRRRESYGLAVLVNGGTKTYLVTTRAGRRLGCLPTAYDRVPSSKAVALSSALIRC